MQPGFGQPVAWVRRAEVGRRARLGRIRRCVVVCGAGNHVGVVIEIDVTRVVGGAGLVGGHERLTHGHGTILPSGPREGKSRVNRE